MRHKTIFVYHLNSVASWNISEANKFKIIFDNF